MTPYQYGANNPIKFIDINGDSIDISLFMRVDKAFGTSYTQTLKNDLAEATGLQISEKNGFLQYTDTGSSKGSLKARKFLKGIIDSKVDKVTVNMRLSKSKAGGNVVLLGKNQIEGFVKGTPSDLNDKTMGWGMTFLHELHHTNAGGGLGDVADKRDFASTGPTVDSVNEMRKELDSNPQSSGNKPYGIRKHYNSITGDNGLTKTNFKYPYTKKGKTKWKYPSITY